MAHRISPELLDRLAGEYTLGTLRGGARRRFETASRSDPEVARAVMRWQQRLLPLDDRLKPLSGGPALWARIERKAFGSAAPAGSTAAAAAGSPRPRWWQRLLSPVPAGALAFGLLLGSVGPTLWRAETGGETQLPESYIGVLADAQGRQGMLVSSLRRGKAVDLKQLSPPALAAGQRLVLWSIDAAGQPSAIAALPNRPFATLALPQTAEVLFSRAVELGVSIEADGSALPARPSQPYLYRGLCGKLWPAAPSPR